MVEFGDSIYYLDFKTLDKIITLNDFNDKSNVEREKKETFDEKGELVTTEFFERTTPKSKEVDGVKYDIIKTMIEYIMDFDEINDDSLGSERALEQTSFGFRLVLNTLLKEGIIKEKQ